MTPCDKDDIFHAADARALFLGKPHTVIDIFDYPFFEIVLGSRVLPFRWERKI